MIEDKDWVEVDPDNKEIVESQVKALSSKLNLLRMERIKLENELFSRKTRNELETKISTEETEIKRLNQEISKYRRY